MHIGCFLIGNINRTRCLVLGQGRLRVADDDAEQALPRQKAVELADLYRVWPLGVAIGDPKERRSTKIKSCCETERKLGCFRQSLRFCAARPSDLDFGWFRIPSEGAHVELATIADRFDLCVEENLEILEQVSTTMYHGRKKGKLQFFGHLHHHRKRFIKNITRAKHVWFDLSST